jgi:FkbM family methyltransferase
VNKLRQIVFGFLGYRQKEAVRHYFLSRQIARGQPIKEKEIELIRRLVAAGDRAADIGANVGQFTRELAVLAGSDGHVYSFEPVGNNFRILTTMISLAKLRNVTPLHMAVGSEGGTRTMVIPTTDSFAGYYLAHFDDNGSEAGRRETVPTATLDELLSSETISALDFIKCDVEGAELDVLRGAATLIRNTKPGFMIEVSRATSADCFAFLHDLGYVAYVYDGKVERVDSYRDGRFSNYFFIHPTSKCMTRLRSVAGYAGG